MDNAANAPSGGDSAIDTAPIPVTTPIERNSVVDVSEAARQLSNWRRQKDAPPETPAAPVAAAVETPPAEQASAAPEEAPGEPTEAQPNAAEELPPIEAPRSLSKEDKELFNSLPRDLQESYAERLRSIDRDVARRQSEAAETKRALESDLFKAKQAQQQYESALPALLLQLQTAAGGEFSDVRSPNDITRMAVEDPNRYLRWDAHQKQVQAVQQQITESQQRQQYEGQQAFIKLAEAADKEFAERHPGVTQKDKDDALKLLKGEGFSDEELSNAWTGRSGLPLRKLQSVIWKATQYDRLKAAPPKPAAKPVPAVQRPGVAQNKGAQINAQISEAAKRLTNSKGVQSARAAADLLKLQRQSAR